MIFDGMRFTRSRSAIHISGMDPMVQDLRKRLGREDSSYHGYCFFARVLPLIKTCMVVDGQDKLPKGYVDTGRKWPNTKDDLPVYAKLVEPDGWSLTNMMYGKDGYIYLCVSGQTYVRGPRR